MLGATAVPHPMKCPVMEKHTLSFDLAASERESAGSPGHPNCYSAIPPNSKTCVYTGLKHAHLYALLTGKGAARPYVRVANLKEPGSSKGKTLFHVGDMLRFLDWMSKTQGSCTEQIPVSSK